MSQTSEKTAEQDAVLRAEIDRSLRHPVMFFFTSGAAWLAVAIVLGLLTSIKSWSPDFLSGCPLLTQGRIFPAHVNILIYGWGMQASFGMILWLMSRLTRQTTRHAGVILTVGHVWNATVALGTIGILLGYGTGVPWMEFPKFVWPVFFLCFALISIWSWVQFRAQEKQEGLYLSQNYLVLALIAFPFIYLTANLAIFCFDVNPALAAGINAWFRSGLVMLFFLPVSLAALFYLVPKVTGKMVQAYPLAQSGFWALALVGPWAGYQKVMGAPLPVFLQFIGATATIWIAVPAFIACYSLLMTAKEAKPETILASPTLRFAILSSIFVAVFGLACALLNIPGVTLPLSQFSLSAYGFDLVALYGVFTSSAFAMIYFVVPRITCREWLSRRLISYHFFFTAYCVTFLALFAIFGGLMQGAGQERFSMPWLASTQTAHPYHIGFTFVWILLVASSIFFFLHLLVMWLRLGRRSSHPTLLVKGHHSSHAHGVEGEVDHDGEAAH